MPDDKTVVNSQDELATIITDAAAIQPTGPQKLGRYEIVRELGKGAMGVVYEGRDPNINRRVAIKTARADVLQASGRAEELMQRFLREAQSAGKLNHPNIITIYDTGEQDGMAYIAMEFLEGGDVDGLMAKKQIISVEETVRICSAVCEALDAAHKQGVVHRDIKPANVVMLKDGTVKVADFGIARMSDSSLTQEGSLIGTPHYMSPEQFQGRQVDGRSDLWSAAVMCYQMLTNQKPFVGETLSTVMTGVLKSTPLPPHEIDVTVNPTLSAVVMKALSKAPVQRYQTGAEMAAALRESIKPKPESAITGVHMLPATVITSSAPVPSEIVAATLAGVAGTGTALREGDVGVTSSSAKSGRGKLIGAGIGLAVLIVAAIAAVSTLGGEKTPGNNANGGGEGAYTRAKFTVFLGETSAQARAWDETDESMPKAFPTRGAGARIVVEETGENGGQLASGTVEDPNGELILPLHKAASKFNYTVSKEGYGERSFTVYADTPGDFTAMSEAFVVLFKDGIQTF